MAKWTKGERDEARADLAALLSEDQNVFTNLRHVARSGMSRVISAHIVQGNGIRDISRLVAKATDSGFDDDRYGVKVSGAGMDMGFHLVDLLSHAIGKRLNTSWI